MPDDFNKGTAYYRPGCIGRQSAGRKCCWKLRCSGSGATIRIRSGASLCASNDPLIVVDGVPVDNSTIEGGGNVIGGIN